MRFKPAPRAQAINKFVELFGQDHNFEIQGERLPPLTCKSFGLPTGTFMAELFVEGTSIATTTSKDWRHAYKLLKLEIERMYSEGISLV